ncbi:hypothetical protein R1flu_029290 [Riccia fluitans]|uniref:Uncharacterized protein n=1 Tax=Riccia fluitans TaxID=41844 RepID=A0ABD1XP31_9MARC
MVATSHPFGLVSGSTGPGEKGDGEIGGVETHVVQIGLPRETPATWQGEVKSYRRGLTMALARPNAGMARMSSGRIPSEIGQGIRQLSMLQGSALSDLEGGARRDLSLVQRSAEVASGKMIRPMALYGEPPSFVLNSQVTTGQGQQHFGRIGSCGSKGGIWRGV